MSATAFQRLRREQAKKEEVKEPSQAELLDGLTVKQLKAMLEEKGVEYDPKAKKLDLIGLIRRANDEPQKEDESDNANAEDDLEKKETEAEDDLEKKPEGAE